MSSAEFGEWLAYDLISPGYPERGDLQTAVVAMTVANAHKGKKGKAYVLSDFILKFKNRTPAKKTAKEIKMKLVSWLSTFRRNSKEGEHE